METPSSTRRVTRSQTQGASMASNNIPTSNFEKGLSNSRTTARKGKQQQSQQQDRSVLFDITNDSPIVGLKTAILVTPLSSAVGKSSAAAKRTPGSGEALLRGQVKTLLQKVEEEAELSKLSLEARSFVHNIKGMLVNSPAGLLAPTPANTPQVLSLSGGAANGGLASLPPSPLVEEMIISQVIEEKEHLEEGSLESQRSIITRSLLEDFSEKSDNCDSASDCLSGLTDLEIASGEENPSLDDDSASVWSVQVNTSARSEEEEEEDHCYDSELAEQARRHTRFVYDSDDEIVNEEEEEEDDYHYEGVEEEEESEAVDELCDFISKFSMDEKKTKELPKSEGKHVRFVYGNDGEIVKEDPVLHLNGLPTPKGKHVRFSEE